MMETTYTRIRSRAREIVSTYPTPDFYKEQAHVIARSRSLMDSNPEIASLKTTVAGYLEGNFGHGLRHARKVSLEAGALVLIEGRQASVASPDLTRQVALVQCAGLLHDIRRKKKNHAVLGAELAADLLRNLPFSPQEISHICRAIRNHEAFQLTLVMDSSAGKLISDCLYDADKFRWGPDNFTDTIWEMVSFLNPPLETFLAHYPKGMQSLREIKHTFRSRTGRHYGPQFIDIGLAVGEELYEVIRNEFG